MAEDKAPKTHHVNVEAEVGSAVSVGGTSLQAGKGKKTGWMQKFLYGVVPQRGSPGRWAIKEWFQKRRDFGNQYHEKVTDLETGEVLHECDEPFTDHQGHGTAKFKQSK